MKPLTIFIIVISIISTILSVSDGNYNQACWSFNTTLWAGMALIYQNRLSMIEKDLTNLYREYSKEELEQFIKDETEK